MRAVVDGVHAEREQRLRALVHHIADPVHRYLARRTDAATADDVLGDVLLVCWRRLDEVPVDPPGAAVPWAIVAARNALANAERSARRQQRVAARIIAVDPPADHVASPDGDDDGETAEREHRVRDALARLRPADAEILRLWAWDELTTPQIAVVLGIAANTAAVRLMRAKARLRRVLERENMREDALDTASRRGDSAHVSSIRPTGHEQIEGGNTHA